MLPLPVTYLWPGTGYDLVEEPPPGVSVGLVVRPHDARHGLGAHPRVHRGGRGNRQVRIIRLIFFWCELHRNPGTKYRCPRVLYAAAAAAIARGIASWTLADPPRVRRWR